MNLEASRSEFLEAGYLQVPGAISERLRERVLTEIDELLDSYSVESCAPLDSARADVFERLGQRLMALRETDGELFEEVCRCMNRLTSVYELVGQPLITELARTLLDDPSICVYCHNLIVSVPSDSWPLDRWHQDAYSSVDLHLVANIALSPCSAENGGLRVIRGGHSRGLVPHVYRDDEPEDAVNRHQVLRDPSAEHLRDKRQLTLAARDLVLLHRLAPHAGGINCSNSVRLVVAVRFTGVRTLLGKRLVPLA